METPEEGTIVKPNGYTIGYLPQESNITYDTIVYNEVKSAASSIYMLEEKIHEISKQAFRFDRLPFKGV